MIKKMQKEIQRAETILKYAERSTQNFFTSFDTVRKGRCAGQGATTDMEQDLLRAALVFAAAGLDSVLKELMRGLLPILCPQDEKIRSEFEKFIYRQLRGDEEEGESNLNCKLLAKVLAVEIPRDELIREYAEHLTSGSLQSTSELVIAIKVFGLDEKDLPVSIRELGNIFAIRNKIVHELDVKLSGQVGRRGRNGCQKPTMQDCCDKLLKLAKWVLHKVTEKIQ